MPLVLTLVFLSLFPEPAFRQQVRQMMSSSLVATSLSSGRRPRCVASSLLGSSLWLVGYGPGWLLSRLLVLFGSCLYPDVVASAVYVVMLDLCPLSVIWILLSRALLYKLYFHLLCRSCQCCDTCILYITLVPCAQCVYVVKCTGRCSTQV